MGRNHLATFSKTGKLEGIAASVTNKAGIYGLEGSVSEWCLDYMTFRFGSDNMKTYAAMGRTLRGASFEMEPAIGRSYVSCKPPMDNREDVGFRVVMGGNKDDAERAARVVVPAAEAETEALVFQEVRLSPHQPKVVLKTGVAVELVSHHPKEGYACISFSSTGKTHVLKKSGGCEDLNGVILEAISEDDVVIRVVWCE